MNQVFALGEATYDILFVNEKPVEARIGGSVLNTSVSLGRLGIPVHFVGTIANDRIGKMTMKFLEENKVSVSYVQTFEGNSRIALAFLDENHNSEYSFYPATGKTAHRFPAVKENDIVLFGSSYALRDDLRSDLLNFLHQAAEQQAMILYDPNFRKSQLPMLHALKPKIEENISLCHLLKGSDEDFLSIFGCSPQQTFSLVQKFSRAVMICTAAEKGVYVLTEKIQKHYEVPPVSPVSTIGAGDTFTAGIIYTLYKHHLSPLQLQSLPEPFWDNVVDTAVKFAQHVCLSYENYLSVDFASAFRIR